MLYHTEKSKTSVQMVYIQMRRLMYEPPHVDLHCLYINYFHFCHTSGLPLIIHLKIP